ncbi:hypothetical protein ElyMa_006027700 [Elysia marginata]|uniref:Uncharacterized protein n=1 Tax=Elysia marginata TaxID=1093978 RepID=A0AAV4GK39_9GAST|nr:hypothetical protein ElyMa_006027700 [Elysia marginata]
MKLDNHFTGDLTGESCSYCNKTWSGIEPATPDLESDALATLLRRRLEKQKQSNSFDAVVRVEHDTQGQHQAGEEDGVDETRVAGVRALPDHAGGYPGPLQSVLIPADQRQR